MDKRRPALVMSPEHRNMGANDVIVIPTSTTLRRMRWHVLLHRGEGGLPATSVVKCEAVLTIPKHFVEPEELGVLSDARMREVEEALLSALGIGD